MHQLKAVRNKKTNRYFILLEQVKDNQLKLINPAGQLLTVPGEFFDSAETFIASDFRQTFTGEQIQSATKLVKQSSPQGRSTVAPKKRVKKELPSRTGLGASWSSARLTFYKFKIDPLHVKQTFRITLDNYGDFEISKEEFQSVFSDVILSKEYNREGSYSYKELPDKARKYLKTESS
jgi:hypothetical protein